MARMHNLNKTPFLWLFWIWTIGVLEGLSILSLRITNHFEVWVRRIWERDTQKMQSLEPGEVYFYAEGQKVKIKNSDVVFSQADFQN